MVVTLVIILSFLCGCTSCQTYNEMNELLNDLLNKTKYNKQLRPLWNQSDVIQVNFTHSLHSIEHFEVQTGDLVTVSLFFVTRYDEMLTWNPSHYGNTVTIALPRKHAWTPRIALARGQTNEEIYIDGSDFAPTRVTNKGFVTMFPAGNFRTKCIIDTTFYPFDKHGCEFNFVLGTHLTSELNFNIPTGDIDTTGFVEHGEWTVESTGCVAISDQAFSMAFPTIKCSLTVSRRPLFELMTYISPIYFLGVLNAVSCWIPPSCGERLTYVVTIYLAFVFMMLATIGRTPQNSLTIPVLSCSTMVVNSINTLALVYNVYVLCLANTPNEELRTMIMLKKRALKEKKMRLQRASVVTCKKNAVDIREDTKNDDVAVREDTKNDDVAEENSDKSEMDEMKSLTGLDIARTCDILFFRAYMLYFSVLTFALAGVLWSS